VKIRGKFYGVGVGPGEPGLLPLVAWETLKRCDLIFVPRAQSLDYSAARRALPQGEIPEDRFREVEFLMDSDRDVLRTHYAQLAQTLADELNAGKNVAYLTLGDSLTYSTYIYTVHALRALVPDLRHRTFPGITSYCALAAETDWPLGEGREKVLILPCPDEMTELQAAIELHDVVVLMKIGRRLPDVLRLLDKLGIAPFCAYGHRVGMPEAVIQPDVSQLSDAGQNGYLATLLIRRRARVERHSPVQPDSTQTGGALL
jgi:precorrin-2/cobalt-factor-2 C20-methyltransferase